MILLFVKDTGYDNDYDRDTKFDRTIKHIFRNKVNQENFYKVMVVLVLSYKE